MSIVENDAAKLYSYLIGTVIRSGKVATYGDAEKATGVPIGPEGSHIGKVLGHIFHSCDAKLLPPLPALLVRKNETWPGTRMTADGTKRVADRHGMPGPGYFVAEGESQNKAGRRRDPGFDHWVSPPPNFDRDTSRWKMKEMIISHQESVWLHTGWPTVLPPRSG